MAPASVLACPELTLLATSSAGDSTDEGAAATAAADAIARATDHMPERAVFRALFGIDGTTEGRTLTFRRKAASALVGVTPESFRVRREGRLLDELAHALLIELSPPRSDSSPSYPKQHATRILLLFARANRAEARALRESLMRDADLDVTSLEADLPRAGSTRTLMDSVREHDAVIHLVSVPFLKSRRCMHTLLPLIKDDAERSQYQQRTVPLIVEDPTLDLFHAKGQLGLVDYWVDAKVELEEQINLRGSVVSTALAELRDDLAILLDIAEHIMRFVRTTTENIYATPYAAQRRSGFGEVIAQAREIGAESGRRRAAAKVSPQSPFTASLEPGGNRRQLDRDEPLQRREPSPDRKRLTDLYNSIVIASENDPDSPEFPPFSPRFPATPAYKIFAPPLNRDVTIKDESHNFTGSHKDRMAWEIVVYYKSIIQDLLSPHARSTALPAPSIISNGSAALAIQVMLRCFGLPSLKALIDQRTDRRIVRKLVDVGCEVYVHDLGERELDSTDVLELTENKGGFDVTARNLVDPSRRTYYDWLAYEILNCDATHIFIPVGTGDLYVNVLTVLQDELIGVSNDRRLTGGLRSIEGLQIYGATSSDRKTKMDRLYAPHRPTLAEARRVVDSMRDQSFCGPASNIYDVDEGIASDALSLARANGIKCDESGIAGLALLLQLSKQHEFPAESRLLVVNTGWLSL